MEIEGVVYRVLPVVKGQSARGEWSKQEVVFDLPGDFNKKVCISFWGDKVQDVASLREGDKVNVSVNVESREYNGRWFTEVRAWKMNKQAADNIPGGAPAADLPPLSVDNYESGGASTEEVDDLPF